MLAQVFSTPHFIARGQAIFLQAVLSAFGATLLNARTLMMIRLSSAMALLCCTACTPVSSGHVANTSASVGEAIQEGQIVRLAEHTNFDWSVVKIYSPYTPRELVCDASGAQWDGCLALVPEYISEGEFLLVFLMDGRYVAHEFHSRANGEYCESSCLLEISADEAVFRAQRLESSSSGRVHYVLRVTAV